ncbi:hypothetical protein D9M70_588520 [compost metagenome]
MALISDGLITIVVPAAIAVASLVQMKPMLLFQGVMAASTPTGSMTTAALPICRVKV